MVGYAGRSASTGRSRGGSVVSRERPFPVGLLLRRVDQEARGVRPAGVRVNSCRFLLVCHRDGPLATHRTGSLGSLRGAFNGNGPPGGARWRDRPPAAPARRDCPQGLRLRAIESMARKARRHRAPAQCACKRGGVHTISYPPVPATVGRNWPRAESRNRRSDTSGSLDQDQAVSAQPSVC